MRWIDMPRLIEEPHHSGQVSHNRCVSRAMGYETLRPIPWDRLTHEC